MSRISVEQAGPNVCAFLDMLAWSEIGPGILSVSDDGYNVLEGSVPEHPLLFDDYSDHPTIMVPGQGSTAAGRYQILIRFWPYYKSLLKLPDFSPISQDRYAIQQMQERHALMMLSSDNIRGAIVACSNIWASLPGNDYGQHQNKFDALIDVYRHKGGAVS